jgi:hypothetical protein
MSQSNVILTPSGVSVGASAVDTQVSHPFESFSPLHANVVVEISAASETTGITFSLKDSADKTDYSAVGDQSAAALVKKTFAGGIHEVSTVTFPDFATAAQGDYISFTALDGTTYAIWLDKDAAGTAPTGAIYLAADVQIEVDIVTGDTATVVGTAAFTEIAAQMDAHFTLVDNEDGTVTFTQIESGVVADPVPKDADDSDPGSISVVVDTAGTNGDVVLATNALTSTSHGWVTGTKVVLSGADIPEGLSAGTYYAIRVDANTLKLAATQALALAGTAIDVTGYGSGTNTLVQASYTIRMLVEDATDAANSGASDSCTVSAVYASVKK